MRLKICSVSVAYPLHEFLIEQFNPTEVEILCESGGFNDLINDTAGLNSGQYDGCVIFPYLDIEIPDLLEKTPEELERYKAIIYSKYQLILDNMPNNINGVFIGFFSRFEAYSPNVKMFIDEINIFIFKEISKRPHINYISFSEIIEHVGWQNLFDHRFRLLNSAPFTQNSLLTIAKLICMRSNFFSTVLKKVLVLDCDNTLWKGILVEDGIENVKFDKQSFPGNAFYEMQQFYSYLEEKGVLIALVSKNDEELVDKFFVKNDSALPLHNKKVITKRINWLPKSENITDIARELDLGLDSFVFIDDSEYEVAEVRKKLPMVCSLQVPKKITNYNNLIDKLRVLFNQALTDGEKSKTHEYVIKAKINDQKAQAFDEFAFIRSLEMRVEKFVNEPTHIARVFEMVHKTNQFNLTTKRYTRSEIESFMIQGDVDVLTFSVDDIFTDHGVVGLGIVRLKSDVEIIVDTLIMSCRIFGRYVETKILEQLCRHYVDRGVSVIYAHYIATDKNKKFSDFYLKNGFKFHKLYNNCSEFELNIENKSTLDNFNSKYTRLIKSIEKEG